jgi:predicted aspartyl protease
MLNVYGGKAERELDVLFDSGASATVMREDVAAEVCVLAPLRKPRKFTGADGKRVTVKEAGWFETTVGDTDISGEVFALPVPLADGIEMIIGVDILQKYDITLEFSSDPAKGDVVRVNRPAQTQFLL